VLGVGETPAAPPSGLDFTPQLPTLGDGPAAPPAGDGPAAPPPVE